ncbi:MAG: hypothetical protein AB8I08_16285 [Sandaracinaceae bacterium]
MQRQTNLVSAIACVVALTGGGGCVSPAASPAEAAVVDGCLEALCAPATAPNSAELEEMARTEAELLAGGEVELRAETDFLGAGHLPMTRLYLFANRTDAPSAATAMDRAAAGETTFRGEPWSEWFSCVEVGLVAEAPPIVGYWSGVPLHWAAEADAADRVEREFGIHHGHVTRRFRSAWLSAFEVVGDEGRAYVDGPTGAVSMNFRVSVWDEATRADRRSQFARAWERRLDAVRRQR